MYRISIICFFNDQNLYIFAKLQRRDKMKRIIVVIVTGVCITEQYFLKIAILILMGANYIHEKLQKRR